MNSARPAFLLFAIALLGACAACSKHAGSPPQALATPPVLSLPVAPPAAGADDPEPKKTALAFANALAGGDIATAAKMVEGTDTRTFAYFAGFAQVVASEHLFAAALKSRFGDAATIPPEIEHIGNLPSMPSNYDQLTEQIDGDKAALIDASGHTGVHLKKVDGTWKIDLFAAEASLPPGAAENLDKTAKQFAAAKKCFDQATAKILDGSYPDSKAALDAVKAAANPE